MIELDDKYQVSHDGIRWMYIPRKHSLAWYAHWRRTTPQATAEPMVAPPWERVIGHWLCESGYHTHGGLAAWQLRCGIELGFACDDPEHRRIVAERAGYRSEPLKRIEDMTREEYERFRGVPPAPAIPFSKAPTFSERYAERIKAAAPPPTDHTAEHEMSPYLRKGGPVCMACGTFPAGASVSACKPDGDYRKAAEAIIRIKMAAKYNGRTPEVKAREPYQGPLSAGLGALVCAPFYRLR